MFPVRYFGVVLLWLALLVPAQAAAKKRPVSPAKLAHDIEDILAGPESERGFWGSRCRVARHGDPLVELNEDKLFTPASNAKLFTTAAVFGLMVLTTASKPRLSRWGLSTSMAG